MTPFQDSTLAETAAVTTSGRSFAYGYSDATVVLHPTENITPTVRITNVVGEIRDMLVTGRDELIVATASGIVQRIRLCDTCLSNRASGALALARLDRAREIGFAR